MFRLKRKSLLSGANTPTDHSNLSSLERTHVPDILCPASIDSGETFTLTVVVGDPAHTNDHRDRINLLEVYADEVLLASVSPAMGARAEVDLQTVLTETTVVRAEATCSLHGLWTASRTVSVCPARE